MIGVCRSVKFRLFLSDRVKFGQRPSEVSCSARREVKCSVYRAEGTLHTRSVLHIQRIRHIPFSEHLVPPNKRRLATASLLLFGGVDDVKDELFISLRETFFEVFL